MATILVRNVEDAVCDRLLQRARLHGRSMEAELRDILRGAVEGLDLQGAGQGGVREPGLGTRAAARFKGIGLREGEELETPPPIEIEPPVFE